MRFKKILQTLPAFCINALPFTLQQPQPKRLNDNHTLATGLHFNGLHNFKHGIHLQTVYNFPIRAHIPWIFVCFWIVRQIRKNAFVIKIRQRHFTCEKKIIGCARIILTMQKWVVDFTYPQTKRPFLFSHVLSCLITASLNALWPLFVSRFKMDWNVKREPWNVNFTFYFWM